MDMMSLIIQQTAPPAKKLRLSDSAPSAFSEAFFSLGSDPTQRLQNFSSFATSHPATFSELRQLVQIIQGNMASPDPCPDPFTSCELNEAPSDWSNFQSDQIY